MTTEAGRPDVVVVLGSKTDLPFFEESKAGKIMTDCLVSWELNIASAHRNPREVNDLCLKFHDSMFLTGAGMASQLAGKIASETYGVNVVFGVALPSPEFPNAMDALLSLTRMPPGTPVICTGIGKAGFTNAAVAACQIMARTKPEVAHALRLYRIASNKPAEIGIQRG